MTVDPNEQRNRATYLAFGAAWAAGDINGLMRLVTDDIVYGASVGPEPGTTYRGRDAVRAGFAAMIEYDRALQSWGSVLAFAGDTAFAEWRYQVAGSGGQTEIIRGVDIFTFRDGLIAGKDAYRKTRGQ